MALYCRRSLVDKLDADEVFEVTRQGMAFYAELFDQPYPFAKFDQVFVPEFNAGAMENVGAVTHSERFIFRDPPTESQRLERAEVILHELAHMWFGNLVTMRWWNDLWLNESFATYIAFVALDEATRFHDGAWKSFNSSMKLWAYRQDQLVTTHPIAGETPDTDATFQNFDGITYGKGASVLKQLVKLIGRDGFQEGMRCYFRRHAWGNATLGQFIAALEEGSGRSLADWADSWLTTSSINTLAAAVESSDGTISSLAIHQGAPADHPTLRVHALDIGLVRAAPSGPLIVETLPAEIAGERADVEAAVGRAEPDLVYPNLGDHAYAKIALDETSVAFTSAHLEQIDDPLLRQLLWMSLWEMVRDRQLRSTEFLGIVRAKVGREPDLELVETVLGRAQLALASYVPDELRPEEARHTFEVVHAGLRAAATEDARIVWSRALIGVARTSTHVALLVEALDRPELVGDVQFDQEMRWAIVAKAIASATPDAERLLAREKDRDASDRGQRMAFRAEAARPDPAHKEATWTRIVGEGFGSFQLTGAAMQGFWWQDQGAILSPFEARYFDDVRSVFERHDRVMANTFARTMFPSYRADPAILERTDRLLAELGAANPMLTRILREAADELSRAVAVRAYAVS